MPIYEYSCPKCGLKFELIRPMSKANEDASCPKCKRKAKRVLSTFASIDEYHNFVPGLGNVLSKPSAAGNDTSHVVARSRRRKSSPKPRK